MSGRVTWKKAILKILTESKKPLSDNKITELIIAKKLKITKGLTPRRTVRTSLYRMLRDKTYKLAKSKNGFYFLKNKKT